MPKSKIIVLGINHKKAPLAIREKFSLSDTEQDLFLSELKSRPEVLEAFVLSTCNRVEIYVNFLDNDKGAKFLFKTICQIKKVLNIQEYEPFFYSWEGNDAVRHLFRVTSGLDSLVLGERQILGQVKSAVERAQRLAMFQQPFNILTNLAIRTGKKAQSETDISSGGSSLGWAAVIMAERILGTLENKSVLIIGAGKMSHLTIQQISNRNLKKLYIMNRTHEKAVPLAENFNATIVSLYDLKDILAISDVCITSVAAPHYIIEREFAQSVMNIRSAQPLVLVDLAVPRNVDPQVAQIPGVKLCSVDDLDEVIQETMEKRHSSVQMVENIVEKKLADFFEKIEKLNLYDESHR